MAAALPSADKITLPKPQVEIETTSTGSTSKKATPPTKSKRISRTPSQISFDNKTSKGTILLQQPLPKYSFQTAKKKPTAVVISNPSSVTSSTKQCNDKTEVSKQTDSVSVLMDSTSTLKPKPVSKVEPLQTDPPETALSLKNPVKTSSACDSSLLLNMPQLAKFPSLESLPFPAPVGSQMSSLETENSGLKDENQRLKKEMESLKRQLDVQFQVNSELKKLLVASVGDDLQFRVENLVRDRAQLSNEIGTFAKKHSEDYEHIDKVSIQADMWRSKFLASRVMIDELASSKAYLAMLCQESQSALQQMLTERHEVRSNLLETYKTLQQVRSAFDPLNTQRSMSVSSTNSLDLARVNQRLSEAIRYRLLPSHVTLDTIVDLDQWTDNLTLAESRANEFLSKKIDPENVRNHLPSNLNDPSTNVIDRFHPYTRFDNLTLNCCVKCQGEMFAI